MIDAPTFENRVRLWWPWLVLSLGVLIIAVGGILFAT
jgi:hypothetical protein